jgi:hypothetical protein
LRREARGPRREPEGVLFHCLSDSKILGGLCGNEKEYHAEPKIAEIILLIGIATESLEFS